MAELESLPVDDIQARHRDENLYSVAQLRSVAAAAGMRSHRKLGRDALAHQIAMKIANFRGYQRLGGETEQKPLVSEPGEAGVAANQGKRP
jgi:hypothetical protein